MTPSTTTPTGPTGRSGTTTSSSADDWDAIDQASADSFPASDPPAWSPGEARSAQRESDQYRYPARGSRLPWIIGGIALAAGTLAVAILIRRART